MNFREYLLVALEGIRNNKLRSFLTTLGIVIGIAAVIAVVAIGQAGRAMIMKEMESYGTNLFGVYVNYRDGEYSSARDFTMIDVSVIKNLVPEVQYLAPVRYHRAKIRGPLGEKGAEIIGTTADYEQVRNLDTKLGKFFTDEDQTAMRRVAVLDEALGNELFGPENPIGQRFIFNDVSVVVVGVLKNEESVFNFDSPKRAYVPLSVLENATRWTVINQLMGSASDREQVYLAMERTKLILERRHNAPPNRYTVFSMEQEMQSANKITGIMTLVIGAIAGISLLVGGIGVMNIMLVSVTERTREIGIRMALGAKRRDILVQFLIEAVVLCALGGIIGIIIGCGGAMLVAKIFKWPSLVSWWIVFTAFMFSAGVGMFFGIYPANQASKLDPIEALRRD